MREESGGYNRRVTVQSATEAADTAGQAIATWGTFCVRYAKVKSEGGSEIQGRNQTKARKGLTVTLPYDSLAAQITAKMRVVYGARHWHIETAENVDEQNEEIKLSCTEAA